VCDLETSRMGAPYIYDISRLKVNFTVYDIQPAVDVNRPDKLQIS